MSVGAVLFEFALPTRIVFGTGALERLAKLPIPGEEDAPCHYVGRFARALGPS